MQIGLTVRESGLSKQIHGIDTFEGHPYESTEDIGANGSLVHHKGLFSGNSMEKVNEALATQGLSNVTLHKGMVEQVLPKFLNHQFCFAHLDMDLYQSTRSALEVIASRITPGGIICFDKPAALTVRPIWTNEPPRNTPHSMTSPAILSCRQRSKRRTIPCNFKSLRVVRP